jgi:hypothetical protein
MWTSIAADGSLLSQFGFLKVVFFLSISSFEYDQSPYRPLLAHQLLHPRLNMTTLTHPHPVPAHELYIEPNELPKLRSNYGKYVDADSVGWMRPTPIDTPMEEIRQRFEDDGYVWMKNVIPREDVLDMREQYVPSPIVHPQFISPIPIPAPNRTHLPQPSLRMTNLHATQLLHPPVPNLHPRAAHLPPRRHL